MRLSCADGGLTRWVSDAWSVYVAIVFIGVVYALVTCRKDAGQKRLCDIQKEKVGSVYDVATRLCCESYLGTMKFKFLLFMCLGLDAELEGIL